jgi:hypothetical protein
VGGDMQFIDCGQYIRTCVDDRLQIFMLINSAVDSAS